ncbi:MAG TPA: hypothetical protein VGQ60_03055 [Nitrospiraceae bacterium]|jgi:hypothetical protein|nr:hypothetical protein [Nitrospiraceae bacterium]
MPNIAFTTLVLVVLAFPGYIFRSSYFSDQFSRRLLPRIWTDDIVKAVLYSLPFHLAGLFIFEVLQHDGVIKHTLDFETGLRLLTGEFAEEVSNYDDSLSAMSQKLYSNSRYILVYYLGVLGVAYAVGHLFRWIVWNYECDVKWPSVFGYRNDWLYTLMGRGKLYVPNQNWLMRIIGRPGKGSVPHERTVVILDALTDQEMEIPGKSQLYSGIVAAFTTDENGTLKEIVLAKAKRGKFTPKEAEDLYQFLWRLWKGRGSDYVFEQEDIPGRDFILKYNTIKNLNLTYLPVDASDQR